MVIVSLSLCGVPFPISFCYSSEHQNSSLCLQLPPPPCLPSPLIYVSLVSYVARLLAAPMEELWSTCVSLYSAQFDQDFRFHTSQLSLLVLGTGGQIPK